MDLNINFLTTVQTLNRFQFRVHSGVKPAKVCIKQFRVILNEKVLS